MPRLGRARPSQPIRRGLIKFAPVPGFTASPSAVPKSHAGNIVLTLTGTFTTWVGGGSEFSISGVAGVVKVAENVTSATAATLTITTGSTTGTLTITDQDGATTTITVATATLVVSPTSGTVSTSPTLTLTGTNTVWLQETAAGLFSVSGVAGCSIGTPTVSTNGAATAVLTIGSTAGTLTVTDNSTGATTTFTVSSVTGTIAVSSPVSPWGIAADATAGDTGSIPITGTYTGGPTNKDIQANLNGHTATIATGAGGNFSGTLTGVPPGTGVLTVSFVNAPSITATVADVSVGDANAIMGQSNATAQIATQQTYTPSGGNKAVVWAGGNTTYTAPSRFLNANDPLFDDPTHITTGSHWPAYATLYLAGKGRPIVYVMAAIGGRSLVASNWFYTKKRPDTGATGAGYTTPILSQLTGASLARYSRVWFDEGENDIDAGTARGTYRAALETWVEQVVSDYVGAKVGLIQPGHDGADSAVIPAWADAIKLAIADVARSGNPNVLPGVVTISDIATSLHLTTAAQALLKAQRLYALHNGVRGPWAVGAQWIAGQAAAYVNFDLALKTGLTHNAALWGVTVGGTPITVNSVSYVSDQNTLKLNLASVPASAPVINFAQGGNTAGGKVWPLGLDYTLPGGATVNQPAEMFAGLQAVAAQATGGASGALLVSRGFSGGIN